MYLNNYKTNTKYINYSEPPVRTEINPRFAQLFLFDHFGAHQSVKFRILRELYLKRHKSGTDLAVVVFPTPPF